MIELISKITPEETQPKPETLENKIRKIKRIIFTGSSFFKNTELIQVNLTNEKKFWHGNH